MIRTSIAAVLTVTILLAAQAVRAQEQTADTTPGEMESKAIGPGATECEAIEPGAIESDAIEIELGDGTVSIHAEETPLDDLLYTLSEKADFLVVKHVDTCGYWVTVDLDGVTWDEGMAELLRGWNYALSSNPVSGVPEKLILISANGVEDRRAALPPVVGDGEEAEADAEPVEPETSMEEAIRIANELIAAQEDPVATAIAAVESAAAAEAACDASGDTEWAAECDPESAAGSYAEALRGLSDYQDPRVLDALAPAIDSKSRKVREAALDVMRYYPPVEGDPETLDRVRHLATSDPSPLVRRSALEAYTRYGDQDDVFATVQDLARKDGPARDIAVREWIRIETERAAALLADPQGGQGQQ